MNMWNEREVWCCFPISFCSQLKRNKALTIKLIIHIMYDTYIIIIIGNCLSNVYVNLGNNFCLLFLSTDLSSFLSANQPLQIILSVLSVCRPVRSSLLGKPIFHTLPPVGAYLRSIPISKDNTYGKVIWRNYNKYYYATKIRLNMVVYYNLKFIDTESEPWEELLPTVRQTLCW